MLAHLSAELVVLRARVDMLETLATTQRVPTPSQAVPPATHYAGQWGFFAQAPGSADLGNPVQHSHANAGF